MEVTVQVNENMVLCAIYQLLRVDREKWLSSEDVLGEIKRVLSGPQTSGESGLSRLLPNSSPELIEKSKKVAQELFPEMAWS